MKALETYHLQITGPSGSGKTYFSERLHELGYPAFDADKFDNLGNHVDEQGNIVEYNHEGGLDWFQKHQWTWDAKVLKEILSQHERIIIFGGAVNEEETATLFDRVFYLHLDLESILKNLRSSERTNPYGQTEVQQQVAAAKIEEFYSHPPAGWIPLYSRDPLELVTEIEKHIGGTLKKDLIEVE
jgi:shikimate kinase